MIAHLLERRTHIAYIDLDRDIDIARVIFVDLWGIRSKGRVAVKDCRKLLIIHLNQTERFQSSVLVRCRDRCHLVSHIPRFVDAEQLLVPRVPEHTPFFSRGIFACDNRMNPSQAPGSGRVYIHDSRVGVRTSEYFPYQHFGKPYISGEYGLSGYFGLRIHSRNALSYQTVFVLRQSPDLRDFHALRD